MNLDKLYKMQEELDNHILINHYKRTGKGISEEELLDNTILALLVEVGELANATRCFKHWSTKGMMDKEVIIEELADVWHFYLSIGNQANIKQFGGDKIKTRTLACFGLSHVLLEIYHSVIAMDTSPHNSKFTEEYKTLEAKLLELGEVLGFTDAEVEQAYLEKHEINYQRQKEGY